MAEITVKQLAGVVGAPVERLLEQIKDAGLSAAGEEDLISDTDKLKLLEFLRGQHGVKKDSATSAADDGDKPRKITLKRKAVSELKVGSSAGRSSRTVAVEVRKKRTIQKDVPQTTAPAETADGEVKPKELEALEQLREDQAQRAEVRERELSKKQERLDQLNQEKKQEEEQELAKEKALTEEKEAEAAKPELKKVSVSTESGDKAKAKPSTESDTRRSKSGKNKN